MPAITLSCGISPENPPYLPLSFVAGLRKPVHIGQVHPHPLTSSLLPAEFALTVAQVCAILASPGSIANRVSSSRLLVCGKHPWEFFIINCNSKK